MAVIHDDVSRRRFLSSAFMGFGLIFGLGNLVVRFGQFLIPIPKRKRFEEILMGEADTIPMNTAVYTDMGGNKIALLRTDKGISAFSRVCTDLGCLVSWDKGKEQFICPCHQGVFDRTGKNIAGPPPRPLDTFEVVAKGKNVYLKVQV